MCELTQSTARLLARLLNGAGTSEQKRLKPSIFARLTQSSVASLCGRPVARSNKIPVRIQHTRNSDKDSTVSTAILNSGPYGDFNGLYSGKAIAPQRQLSREINPTFAFRNFLILKSPKEFQRVLKNSEGLCAFKW